MDIQTKKYMLYVFTIALIAIVGMEVYKVMFSGRTLTLLGGIVQNLFAIGGYSITFLVLNHDIKIRVHPDNPQRFVLEDLKLEKL